MAQSSKPCPVCRRSTKVHRLAPIGFWEKVIFARLSCFPFRCRKCGRRFLRRLPAREAAISGLEGRPVVVPDPLPEKPGQPSEEYQRLVEDLRRAEKARGLGPSGSGTT